MINYNVRAEVERELEFCQRVMKNVAIFERIGKLPPGHFRYFIARSDFPNHSTPCTRVHENFVECSFNGERFTAIDGTREWLMVQISPGLSPRVSSWSSRDALLDGIAHALGVA